MLKQTMIAAFSLTAVAAFAGDDFNFETATIGEKKAYVVKHAYMTLNAPDAYVISSAIEGLPSNKASAIVNGLARNAWQAMRIKDEKQMAANMMEPSAMWTETSWSGSNSDDSSRSMRMLSVKPKGDLSYTQAIDILNAGNDQLDKGLVWSMFEPRSFTETLVPTVKNERLLDAITHQIQANAMWTEPYRLKYTSLSPKSW